MTIGGSMKRVLADSRAWEVHHACTSQSAQRRFIDRPDGLFATQRLRRVGEMLRMIAMLHLHPELLRFAMTEKTTQKRFTRRITTHQFGARGRVGFRMVVDGRDHELFFAFMLRASGTIREGRAQTFFEDDSKQIDYDLTNRDRSDSL
jgi:hypothetical protein